MEVKVLKLTLLNHLFYYTEVSGGSTSASVTGDFIGDLALTYAFDKALRSNDNYYKYLKKPEYQEVLDFGFYCSAANPTKRSARTEAYIQGTVFNVDGLALSPKTEGTHYYKASKSPYKTYRQVQGIQIGTSYQALFFSKSKVDLPPVIRVGRALETLVSVEEIKLGKDVENEFWLNAFSLKTIFGNLNKAVDLLVKEQKVNFSMVLENYNIIRQITYEDARTIFKDSFSNG